MLSVVRRPVLAFVVLCAGVLAAPLLWRAVLAAAGPRDALPPSYLPALEASRRRDPFDASPREALKRERPAYVVIGDSMAGRINTFRLADLAGVPASNLLDPATGAAHWYLILKNELVASFVKPAWVIVTFRDTNLTDPLFRLAGAYRGKADALALDREPALNAVVAARMQGPWFQVHAAVDRLYAAERARAWVEPALAPWLARLIAGRSRRPALLDHVNAMFALERLRPMAAADLEAADDHDTDFHANVGTSTLPLILGLAKDAGLRLCFIRVLRRPVNGQPAPESAGLQHYVRDLRAYLEAHGTLFIDDRDDPELAGFAYADGDHIANEEFDRYTDRLYEKLTKSGR